MHCWDGPRSGTRRSTHAGQTRRLDSAVLAPSEEARKPYLGGAILMAPMAALVCWGTVAGYRKVRRIQLNTHPRRPASAVYAELVSRARTEQAQKPPDPHRQKRQRRLTLFLGISAIGWALGRIVEQVDENLDGGFRTVAHP